MFDSIQLLGHSRNTLENVILKVNYLNILNILLDQIELLKNIVALNVNIITVFVGL